MAFSGIWRADVDRTFSIARISIEAVLTGNKSGEVQNFVRASTNNMRMKAAGEGRCAVYVARRVFRKSGRLQFSRHELTPSAAV